MEASLLYPVYRESAGGDQGILGGLDCKGFLWEIERGATW
jgi:hypothetical protein